VPPFADLPPVQGALLVKAAPPADIMEAPTETLFSGLVPDSRCGVVPALMLPAPRRRSPGALPPSTPPAAASPQPAQRAVPPPTPPSLLHLSTCPSFPSAKALSKYTDTVDAVVRQALDQVRGGAVRHQACRAPPPAGG
jgi:hypothetical protein